jgi:hypothetical protein
MVSALADVGKAEKAQMAPLFRSQGRGVAEAHDGLGNVANHAPVVGGVKVG